MNDKKIKVLIVDDSLLMRCAIHNLLIQDDEFEVVGAAKDGIDAIEKAKALNPDVITLDVEMPSMDGIQCLRELMKQGNYGIIMISGHTVGGTNATIKALELGAFDFVTKSDSIFEMSTMDKGKEIIDKLKLAYLSLNKADILNHKIKKKQLVEPDAIVKPSELKYIVAIGISTGGPKSLAEIIPEFPSDIPAAIVIVQHMPPGFTASLANRLNSTSSMKVSEAKDMDVIEAGHVYIAPGDYHLTFKNSGNKVIIKLNQEPHVGGFRPNINVMMESLAEIDFGSVIGVIMTGMGNDGTRGLKRLKDTKGAYVIAQDESTSVVFGMPRSAIEQGVVDEIAPLQDIPTCIMNYMGVRR